jgi:RecG-like helicase
LTAIALSCTTEVIDKPMDELRKFTPTQRKQLKAEGFNGLYDILTYFPYTLTRIEPLLETNLVNDEAMSIEYLHQDMLRKFQLRSGSRPYWVLEWANGIQMYYFNSAKYTHNLFEIGKTYQMLVSKQNTFYTVQKIQLAQQYTISERFVLGKASTHTSYLLPKYNKKGLVDTNLCHRIHNRLERNDYLINLKGMVPHSIDIPEVFDAWTIHHPPDIQSFSQSLRQWKKFQVFLYIATFKTWTRQKQTTALPSFFDEVWLQQQISTLPYQLSNSQQNAIANILNGLSAR